jgi:three-Cys-motif partner protein
MAKDDDREHFEDYREQTQIKHEILAAYLPAYFHILKAGSKNLVFIDGFAGRGTYTRAEGGELIDGSPLLALKLIAGNKAFADRVSTVFVESDPVLFEQLQSSVNRFYEANKHIRKPLCLKGTFADRVGEIIDTVPNLAPTFLFVDPCGVSGVSIATIRSVMKNDKCEAFIFFNIDGVRRIAGLDELSPILIDLLGSKERAQKLCGGLRATAHAGQREELILDHYRSALKEDAGAGFTIPFRIESEDKQKTSHYLIHASKHPLGFKIMKDVMWRRGHSVNEQGALEFVQASRTNIIPLFDRADHTKKDILAALKNGPLRVAEFCEDWVCRPDDSLCETAYKSALLELEASGKIVVRGKDGKNITPAAARPKRNGKSTLANDYFVGLPDGARTT